MTARPVFIFLLVLNLGAATWWLLHTPRAPRTEAAANLPPLAIVRDVNAEAPTANNKAALALNTPPKARAPGATCVALGAYSEAKDVQRGLAALRQAGVEASAVTRVHSPRGFNVLIPPLPSEEAATAMQARLVAAGFTDQFLFREGTQANGIALGRFSTEAAAQTQLARLKAADFPAQVSPVGPSTSELWIQAVQSPAQTVETLRGLAQAQQAKTVPCDG